MQKESLKQKASSTQRRKLFKKENLTKYIGGLLTRLIFEHMETNSYGDEQNSREKVKAYWVSLLNGARSDNSFEKRPGPSALKHSVSQFGQSQPNKHPPPFQPIYQIMRSTTSNLKQPIQMTSKQRHNPYSSLPKLLPTNAYTIPVCLLEGYQDNIVIIYRK